MVPGCGWQKYPDKTSKAVLIKCLPDKTSTPVLKKCLHDKTSKAGRSWKNVFLTKRPSWQNVHPDKTLILTKRLLTTILHCRVGIWPFFFVCQMLLKVPLCFDLLTYVCQGQDSIYPEKPSPSLFGNPLRFHQRQLLVANCNSFDKWSFYLCQLLEFPSRRFAQPPSNCTGDDIFWCHTVLQFTLCMICFVEVSCCWCTVFKKKNWFKVSEQTVCY